MFLSIQKKLYQINDEATNIITVTIATFIKYGVKVEDKDNMLIITTADDLHHYTDNEMFDFLVSIVEEENSDVPDEILDKIITVAQGSCRNALQLLEKDVPLL